jgi:hypothetical protein
MREVGVLKVFLDTLTERAYCRLRENGERIERRNAHLLPSRWPMVVMMVMVMFL